MKKLKVVVLSSLFPSSVRKQSGLFVRERMFRVAKSADLEVVSPVPWFPGQTIIRFFKPNYRPMPALQEQQMGITVHYPRFLSVPGFFRQWDGKMMAIAAKRTIKKIDRKQSVDIIDSHFTYPDGLAATIIGSDLNKKVTITLRGTELSHSRDPKIRSLLLQAWEKADHMICVAQSLKNLAISLGADEKKFTVVGNGVDTDKFTVTEQTTARKHLGIEVDSKVLITVGGLVKRKGFHLVIDCLPELLKKYPDLIYLIVGGASAEGNIEQELKLQAKKLNVEQHVRFLGALPPEALGIPLSSADLFVLATANEGWANVILESMACGVPVVATDVGGNKEVINTDFVGQIVAYNQHHELLAAIVGGLEKQWDRQAIINYAADNHWDNRITSLHNIYQSLMQDAEKRL